MKKTFSVVLAGMFAALVCGTVFAGERKDPGKWQEQRIEKMAKDLNLTADQKAKIEAIFKANEEQRKAEMEKMREAAKTARTETDQKIQAVLTPEQAQKYAKMQDERKAKMEKRMKKAQSCDKNGACCPCGK